MKNSKKVWLAILLIGIVSVTFNSCQEDVVENPQLEEELMYNFGYIPTPQDVYESIPVVPILKEVTLATSVSLDCPPVGDQGYEGSCTAWGTAYAVRSISYHVANGGNYSFSSNVFSPEYVYNQIKATDDCGSGSWPVDALDLLIAEGVCYWDAMPYTDVDCDEMPDATQLSIAANYKISGYNRVDISTDAIKQQLAAGRAVIVCGPIKNAFYNLGYNQVITKYVGRNYGGHCYACVGYDDARGAFKFMNSWGTGWGTDGFGWVSYDVVDGRKPIWTEAYVVFE